MDAPTVMMIAGPNGAGKSSIAPRLLAETLGILEFVNADTIARGLSAFNVEDAALSAGRVMLNRIEELAAELQSFAFETTGASRSFAARIKGLKESGYIFLVAYVWVDSAEVSVQRVAKRVILGGHNIPEQTIRRRYLRSLRNFFELYVPIADAWQFYNNSGAGEAILVAEGGKTKSEVIYGAETWQSVLKMAQEIEQ